MKLKNLYCIVLLIILFTSCSSTKSGQQQLLARIITAEDKLEILTLLSGSAFSSDVASESYWTKMFTQDAVFDQGQERQYKGLEEILKIVDSKIQLKYFIDAYKLFPGKDSFFLKNNFINKLSGNDIFQQQIKDGKTEAEIKKSWEPGLTAFKAIRKKYLLYKDFE